MSSRSRFLLMAATKLSVSLAFLGYCLNDVPLGELVALFHGAHVAMLLALVPLIAAEAFSGAWRFKLILDTVHELPVRTHVAHYLVASYFNILLPGSMGGDAVRVLMLTRSGAGVAPATLTVLVDRVLGVCSLVVIALIAATLADVPDFVVRLVQILALAIALGVAMALLGYRWIAALAARRPWLDPARRTVSRIRAHPLAVARSAAVSLLFQLLTIGFTWLIALALDLQVHAAQVFALVPLTWLATMIPVSVGGLGVRELTFTYLFGMLGVPVAAALALSLGTYAVFVVLALCGALIVALVPRTRATAERHGAC